MISYPLNTSLISSLLTSKDPFYATLSFQIQNMKTMDEMKNKMNLRNGETVLKILHPQLPNLSH